MKMMKLKKIPLLIIFTIIVLISAAPVKSTAETIEDTCGSDCTYVLSEDGTLTIRGTGTITKKFNKDKQINEKIKKIVIEEGIEKIGNGCFGDLKYNGLEISLPDTLTEIGRNAFDACLIKDIDFPKKIKKIGDNAFQYIKLEEIALPEKLEEVGEYAFWASHIRKVSFPGNLKIIPDGMFALCNKLESIDFPKNLTEIGEQAFAGCRFTNVKIPDTVKKVEADAFNHCKRLETITVGKSVKKISKKFVSSCYALKKIVNHSKISIPLDTLGEKRVWYVDGKKVTVLKPGKTAKAVYQNEFKIKYELDGGKIIGKKPETYTYHKKTYLPTKVKKKGYTFMGWYIYARNDWEYFPKYIPEDLYGTLTAKAIFKKYNVTSSDGRIKVTVEDKDYGKKGYNKADDAYYFRYSENKDMSDSFVVVYTAPYGKGLSGKLEKGKTYYVEVTRYIELYLEDSEDYEEPPWGWHGKRKVTIK